MTKVRQVVIPRRPGYRHDGVECAIRMDGSTPAFEFLMKLRSEAWPDGVVQLVNPNLAPKRHYYVFISRLRHLAETGLPADPKAINALLDGLWEVKAVKLRIPFFDLDEKGNLVKKGKNKDRHLVDPEGNNTYWEYPKFEKKLILTHGFPKPGGKTPPPEIELAKLIRDEDLQND